MREHRLIERMVKIINNLQLEINEKKVTDSNYIEVVVDFFKTYADKCHHGKEEDILFKKLSTKNLKQEHQTIMNELIEDHAYARKTVNKLKETNTKYRQGSKKAIMEINALLKELSTFTQNISKKKINTSFTPA